MAQAEGRNLVHGQIAQMEYCNKDAGTGRAETLEWVIKMLNADAAVREDIHFALVKGLGTVLNKSNQGHEEQFVMMLDDAIERTFLEMLNDAIASMVMRACSILASRNDCKVHHLMTFSKKTGRNVCRYLCFGTTNQWNIASMQLRSNPVGCSTRGDQCCNLGSIFA